MNESNSKAVVNDEMVSECVDESSNMTVERSKMMSRNVNESSGKVLVNEMKVIAYVEVDPVSKECIGTMK